MAALGGKRKAESLQETFTVGESCRQSTAEQEAAGAIFSFLAGWRRPDQAAMGVHLHRQRPLM